MLPEEKEMEVLEVYDLTQSYRDTAQLCGVDHHTVARAVAQRAQGLAVAQAPAPSKLASAFIDKVLNVLLDFRRRIAIERFANHAAKGLATPGMH